MIRTAVLALALTACGRSQGIPDQDLGGLVVETKKPEAPIDVERAAKEPAELGRALMRPYRASVAGLGPHTVSVSSTLVTLTDDNNDKKVDRDLSDHATLELGDAGAYHAVYTNSADYGRETIYVKSTLYLRPRYQRWHQRAPETPDEPQTIRDLYLEPIAATWELLAPGAELTDRGQAQVAGRAGRKIELKLAPDAKPAAETIDQRKWREARTIDGIAGEVVLDADKGVPLAVKLAGTIGFQKDGKRYTLKVSVDAQVSGVGTVTPITAPAADDVVATPERMREVDDRDFLLQGIAPALRKNPDGTAVAPAPKENK